MIDVLYIVADQDAGDDDMANKRGWRVVLKNGHEAVGTLSFSTSREKARTAHDRIIVVSSVEQGQQIDNYIDVEEIAMMETGEC